jgi:Tfp pilus assembly protein FimT
VLVLAIMGIFAALAAPRYGRASTRYRADLAAQRIAADLRWAQACAKAASAPRTVSFSTAAQQYQVLGVPSPDGVAGDYTVSLSAEPYRADLVSVSFATGPQIVFDGWGVPDGGGTVVVAAGTQQKTVTVAAGTGRATVQ